MTRHQLHNWLIHWCLLLLFTTRRLWIIRGAPPKEREGLSSFIVSLVWQSIVLTHHPTYCTTAEADITNSRCRRKQYDSSARSIEAAATTSQSQRAPCDRCAGWVIPIGLPATLCWLCWSDQCILINFTCHQSIMYDYRRRLHVIFETIFHTVFVFNFLFVDTPFFTLILTSWRLFLTILHNDS